MAKYPDRKPDMTGLDDGPPLPLRVVNAWKKPLVISRWKAGCTMRDIAIEFGISHETVRAWTDGLMRTKGASRRPQHN